MPLRTANLEPDRPADGPAAATPATTPGARSALLVVCLTVFVDMLGFGIILPELPFRAEQLGGAGTWVGTVLTAYALAQFIAAPVLGGLSDRYGRRRVLLLSLVGSTLSLALTGLAGSLALLLLARSVAGGFGGAIAVGQAYAVDLTPPRERTHALGLVGAAIGLGFVCGPALGGGLAAVGLDFRACCLVAAGIAAVNFAAGLAILPTSARPPAPTPAPTTPGATTTTATAAPTTTATTTTTTTATTTGDPMAAAASTGDPAAATVAPTAGSGARAPLRARIEAALRLAARTLLDSPGSRAAVLTQGLALRSLRPVLLAGFAATSAFAGMETTFALLGRERFGLGPAGFGAVFAGVGVVMALVQGGLVGRLSDRFGDRVVAVAGALMVAAGLVVVPFAPAALTYLTLAVVGAGQGLLTTATAALVAVRGGHRIGGWLGVGQSAGAAARVVGPLIAGVAFDIRPALPYLLGGVLCAVAALLMTRTVEESAAAVPVTTFTVDAPEVPLGG